MAANLLFKHKALSSNSIPPKKKKNHLTEVELTHIYIYIYLTYSIYYVKNEYTSTKESPLLSL
jgi:hypothetical protein